MHIALYLTSLIDNKSTSSVIDSVIYSIKWAHILHGFDDPTAIPLLKIVRVQLKD